MNRCVWCNRILWPWDKQSPGKTMHRDCFTQVNIIQDDNQRHYQMEQARMRWEEEDRL